MLGITLAPVTGLVISEIVTGAETSADIHAMAPGRMA
jgi:glycine/D-amino acid oxidase-like deaminating enzyme